MEYSQRCRRIVELLLLTVSLLFSTFATKETPNLHHSKVLILGAGMSGIKAAKTLHDGGLKDFTILEGNDRIGGRMKDATFEGTVIELGANWVQGIENNPIWELAQEYRLNGNFTMGWAELGSYVVRDEQGRDVTDQDGHVMLREAMHKLDEIAEQRHKGGLRDIDERTGLRLAGWFPQNTAQDVMEYFYEDFDAAVRPQYISAGVNLRTNGSIHSQFGTQYFVFDARGYAVLVEEMAKTFLEPRDCRLVVNQIVDKVIWNETGVQVSTTSGRLYTADYLLVTFSIGVLKNEMVKFVPDLPARLLEAIYKIEMADYIKIFLKFPRKFWDEKQYILYASKRRGYYPIWQDLETDAGVTGEELNILIITVTGEEATRVQYQSDEETQREIMTVLRNVYGVGIPDPIAIYYPRWRLDPLFFGCYSNNPIGINHEDYLVLQSNVSRMYFAGEATNEEYNGYVHGAYYSGLNRASKMLRDMKREIHHLI